MVYNNTEERNNQNNITTEYINAALAFIEHRPCIAAENECIYVKKMVIKVKCR